MNTKLTLTIEKDVIEKAKEYSARQGQSLSSLVENYFKRITFEKKEEPEKSELKPLPESFMRLEGCLKHEGEFDYKEELTKALMEKYGLYLLFEFRSLRFVTPFCKFQAGLKLKST